MRRFSEEHVWAEISGRLATIGISHHAAEELGEITFLELPESGVKVAQGDALGVVESVKAAAEVYSPLSGKVVEVNRPLLEDPALLNQSPERDGWLCKLADFDVDEFNALMSEEAYAEFIGD